MAALSFFQQPTPLLMGHMTCLALKGVLNYNPYLEIHVHRYAGFVYLVNLSLQHRLLQFLRSAASVKGSSPLSDTSNLSQRNRFAHLLSVYANKLSSDLSPNPRAPATAMIPKKFTTAPILPAGITARC